MNRRLPVLILSAVVWACGGQVKDPYGATPDAPDDSPAGTGSVTPFEAAASGDATPATDPAPGLAPATGDDSGGAPDAPAAPPGPPFDAGIDGVCALPVAPGDLANVELMIESIAGTGDHGEWVEVQSRLDCAVDLRGLHGECPRGAKAATFDVTDHLWVPSRGTLVVADSIDPAINHDLPGTLVAWSGRLGDVLRNKGTTVSLRLNDALIDAVTYPALPLTVGASLSFPSDCDPALRSDWTRWVTSRTSWFPAFLGTPNAPNADVTCPR